MTDYFDAFTRIARQHAQHIEDGVHTDPRDRPPQYEFYCPDHDYGWSTTEDGIDEGCAHCRARKLS